MVDFWWRIFCQFSPGRIGMKVRTEMSLHSSLQEKKYVTLFALEEQTRIENGTVLRMVGVLALLLQHSPHAVQ